MKKSDKEAPNNIVSLDFKKGKKEQKKTKPYKTEYDPEIKRNRIITNKKKEDENLPF